ncbi:MAG: ABC transporter ATP-binding protein [Alphaproteobacteria bacterium]|nr:ABC transporter ATP-binding protein [Alphaproteobacteria bacterium]
MVNEVKAVDVQSLHIELGRDASRVHVLKGIDLTINQGEAVGLVGPSGSGKSTLLMAMAGLERAGSGKIIIADQDITTMSEDELAQFRGRQIGIVFQSFHLIETMTALENVAVPLELAGHNDPFTRARKELEAVGLKDRLSHYPSELSGGEQQRVAIARALAPDPTLLLADEPTGNLDATNGDMIVELLFALKRERNMTMVLVTHDLRLAARCDRTIQLNSGKIVTKSDASS